MNHGAGLDVSRRETSICIVDEIFSAGREGGKSKPTRRRSPHALAAPAWSSRRWAARRDRLLRYLRPLGERFDDRTIFQRPTSATWLDVSKAEMGQTGLAMPV